MPTTTTPLTSSSKQDLFQQKENQDPVPTLFDPAPPAKEEEEKSLENPKNSKDSIMALYGSSSSQQTMYNVPGGLYIPQSSSSHSISNGPISTSSSTTTNAMMFGQQSQPHSQMQQQPQPLPQQHQQPQPQSATAAMSNMMGYGMMTQQPVYNAQQQQYMHQQYQLQLQLQLQQQQQQYQMQQYQQQQLQMQQVQQVQQQMQALRVGGGGSTAGVPAQMGWQQPTQGLQPGISAAAGAGGWGAMTGSGQTLSTQLWK
uniref:Mediator of RNA polymerase II transcription subunit 15-like isoform X1 n=1 Tax=Saccoglossus kowalevskii TaxID=10224 RepID=A0ABM0LXS3_SACKO|nr:PREDICTED: mediator of RNA polymerase II transcription subunit 15-like isoform X1 [Saccoglossus kowalevskii]